MQKKTILVTGSSGTIGTRLCEKLLEQGHRVIGADIRKNKWNPTIDKLTIRVDLRNRVQTLKKLPAKVDLVIHLAANARVFNLVVDPTMARDNMEMTFNALEYVRTNKIKGFMLASSREVYGNTGHSTHAEHEVDINCCESPYTASKLASEALVWAYYRCYGLPFVIFRFSNVYGMYDDSDRVVPLFIGLAKKHADIVVFGKDKVLDFTYIDDTVGGILLAVEKFGKVNTHVMNLACGRGTSIMRVAEIIKKKMGARSKISAKGNRTGEVIKYIADIKHAKKHLDYKPVTSIEKGIDLSIAWYLKHLYK
ncbi:MAG: NAD-dependent epimerase/dehydratase family protein [Patescibacteria group bacterium]